MVIWTSCTRYSDNCITSGNGCDSSTVMYLEQYFKTHVIKMFIRVISAGYLRGVLLREWMWQLFCSVLREVFKNIFLIESIPGSRVSSHTKIWPLHPGYLFSKQEESGRKKGQNKKKGKKASTPVPFLRSLFSKTQKPLNIYHQPELCHIIVTNGKGGWNINI